MPTRMPVDFDMNDENDPLFDEDMAGSPLEGIAESVLVIFLEDRCVYSIVTLVLLP